MAHGEQQDRILHHAGGLLMALMEAGGFDLAQGGPKLMGTKAACDYLDIGETKLRELVSEKEIPPPIEVGGRPKYERAELDKYVQRLKRRQHAPPPKKRRRS